MSEANRRYENQRGTILVVDDEPNIADLVELYLAREGFRVRKAGSGEDALAALEREHPRLVVLDVGLPDISGLDVCTRLRATSNIPVIFLTADSEIDRVLGLELGGDDYLTKPFSPAELVARVKAVLRRSDGSAAGIRQTCCRSVPSRLIEVAARCASTKRSLRLPRRSSTCCYSSPNGPGAHCRGNRSSMVCGDSIGTAIRARSTCTSRKYARRSVTAWRSPPCAALATGSSHDSTRGAEPTG